MTSQKPLPKHIAFIMDGNGRWATAQGWPRLKGHEAGVKSLRNMLKAGAELGVECMTFYAFSTENWKRPQEEVSGLMALARGFFTRELKKLVSDGVRVRFIGDRSPSGGLPQDIIDIINVVERDTAHNSKITAVIALNYGGRDEVSRAVQALARKVEDGVIVARDIDENMISDALDTSGLPEVDLLIRTSGEQRLSNFLPWQLTYAEMYFTDVHWPDFNAEQLEIALQAYGCRDRRFGKV